MDQYIIVAEVRREVVHRGETRAVKKIQIRMRGESDGKVTEYLPSQLRKFSEDLHQRWMTGGIDKCDDESLQNKKRRRNELELESEQTEEISEDQGASSSNKRKKLDDEDPTSAEDTLNANEETGEVEEKVSAPNAGTIGIPILQEHDAIVEDALTTEKTALVPAEQIEADDDPAVEAGVEMREVSPPTVEQPNAADASLEERHLREISELKKSHADTCEKLEEDAKMQNQLLTTHSNAIISERDSLLDQIRRSGEQASTNENYRVELDNYAQALEQQQNKLVEDARNITQSATKFSQAISACKMKTQAWTNVFAEQELHVNAVIEETGNLVIGRVAAIDEMQISQQQQQQQQQTVVQPDQQYTGYLSQQQQQQGDFLNQGNPYPQFN